MTVRDVFQESACLLGMIAGLVADWPNLALIGAVCGNWGIAGYLNVHRLLLPNTLFGMMLGMALGLVMAVARTDRPVIGAGVEFVVRSVLGLAGMALGDWAIAGLGSASSPNVGYLEAAGMVLGMMLVMLLPLRPTALRTLSISQPEDHA